jgi:hypothetical protein
MHRYVYEAKGRRVASLHKANAAKPAGHGHLIVEEKTLELITNHEIRAVKIFFQLAFLQMKIRFFRQ